MRKPYTRKELITDCVNAYIRNNPDEWKDFLQIMNQKKAKLADEKFAVVADDLKSGSLTKMRHIFSFPEKLLKSIEIILDTDKTQDKFLNSMKEKLWMYKNFPQFTIAKETNFDSNEPIT
jgi:hypothetical protein